jgi:hypothetical protein
MPSRNYERCCNESVLRKHRRGGGWLFRIDEREIERATRLDACGNCRCLESLYDHAVKISQKKAQKTQKDSFASLMPFGG